MKSRQALKRVLISISGIIAAVLIIIIVDGLLGDKIDDAAWESFHAAHKSHVETDTIAPGLLLNDDGITSLVNLGDNTANALKRLGRQYEIDTITTGPDPSERNYVLSQSGQPSIILQNAGNGTIATIFILNENFYVDDSGMHVQSLFGNIPVFYPEAEFRLGETEDGLHGSCELCKISDNILLVKWLDEDSTHLANYDESGIFRSFKKGCESQRVDEIIITTSAW